MTPSKIVVRFVDGRVLKGYTGNFVPTKSQFHLTPVNAPPATRPFEIHVEDLKAIFYVKDFDGNPAYRDVKEFQETKPVIGRKIRVVFKDNEELVGTTQGYQPGRPGFFMVPADPNSNIDRCFVVSAATKEITLL